MKLFKDLKVDKLFKLMMGYNEDSKKHIIVYKNKFEETKARKEKFESLLNQEVQRRNRETRDSNSVNR